MDPSTKVMIEQTQAIETERLLISCRIKECEHRIALQVDTKERLTQMRQSKAQAEAELGASLQKLNDAQDHLKRQLLSQADSLRKCEVEEALLLENAEERLKSEEEELLSCQTKLSELQALEVAFKTPPLVSQVEKETEALHQKRLALNEEQQALLTEIHATERAIEAVRMPLGCGDATASEDSAAPITSTEHAPAGNASETTFVPAPTVLFTAPDESAEAEELELLRAQVAQKQAELDRLAVLGTTRGSAVQREVADLSKRSAELHLWRDQAQAALNELHARQEALESAAEKHVCFQCLKLTVS